MIAALEVTQQLSEVPSQRTEKRSFLEEHTLDLYRSRITEADVVLEMPAGHDPALAAFLIAEDALARGLRIAYLTSDGLADRTLVRADALPGLRAVKLRTGQNSLSDLVAYYNAQALGVMDFSAYFNTNPKIEPADLVVFDDKNMAEQLIGSLFALRVDRWLQRQAYDGLCELLLSLDGDRSAIERMRRGAVDPTASAELLKPREWVRVAGTVAEMLTGVLSGEDAHFTWPRLQPCLHECWLLVGPAAIEIRPPHQLIRTLPGYRHARQRVHLTTGSAEPEFGGVDVELPDPERVELSASIRYAVAYLRKHFTDSDLTLNRVARAVHVSRYHFSRSFKEQTGWRFIDFVTMLRLTKAGFLLRETDISITRISRDIGYRELSHFQRMFKKRFGMPASNYRAAVQEGRLRHSC